MEGKWGLVFCLLGFILGLLLGLSKSDPTIINGLVNGLIGWAWVDFYTRVLHKTCLNMQKGLQMFNTTKSRIERPFPWEDGVRKEDIR